MFKLLIKNSAKIKDESNIYRSFATLEFNSKVYLESFHVVRITVYTFLIKAEIKLIHKKSQT